MSLKRLRFGDAGVDREEFLCRDHVVQAMWCRKQWDGRICTAFSVDSWALQQSLGIKVLRYICGFDMLSDSEKKTFRDAI